MLFLLVLCLLVSKSVFGQFDVPILLLIFNRPDVQQHVFDQIRIVQPKQLYIAADGARSSIPADKEKCARARNIINQIDWPCDVHTLFRGSVNSFV